MQVLFLIEISSDNKVISHVNILLRVQEWEKFKKIIQMNDLLYQKGNNLPSSFEARIFARDYRRYKHVKNKTPPPRY